MTLHSIGACSTARAAALASALMFSLGVVAGPVGGSGDAGNESAPALGLAEVPADLATSSSGQGARPRSGPGTPADSIDFGEAGALLRLVEGASQHGASSPGSTARTEPRARLQPDAGVDPTAAFPPGAGRAALKADDPRGLRRDAAPLSARMSSEVIENEAAEPERPREPPREVASRQNEDGGRVLADLATADERGSVRSVFVFIKSVLRHPITWLVLAIVGAASLVMSFAGRRGG